MTTKSHSEEAQTTKTPFTDCIEQMMSACGPEMKKWMEACTSNTGEACSTCCGTQPATETDKQK